MPISALYKLLDAPAEVVEEIRGKVQTGETVMAAEVVILTSDHQDMPAMGGNQSMPSFGLRKICALRKAELSGADYSVMIREDLDISPNMASKLIKIVNNAVLGTTSTRDQIPTSWD